jgi:membrane protein
VLFVGISVFAITVLLAAVELSESSWVAAWLPPSGVLSVLAGFAGEVALFGLIYYVLTPVTVPARHALVGAIAAALMWELMRQVLVWYFANLSSVNMIYGTFATVLVIVLSLQVAAGILLLGAQVIREYGKLPDDC